MGITLRAAGDALSREGVPSDTVDKVLEYISRNHVVWAAFEKFALQAISHKKTVGAKAIMERVRWEVEIEGEGEFKVNNNYTAYVARFFALKYPDHAQYFEMRAVRGLAMKEAA